MYYTNKSINAITCYELQVHILTEPFWSLQTNLPTNFGKIQSLHSTPIREKTIKNTNCFIKCFMCVSVSGQSIYRNSFNLNESIFMLECIEIFFRPQHSHLGPVLVNVLLDMVNFVKLSNFNRILFMTKTYYQNLNVLKIIMFVFPHFTDKLICFYF